MRKSIICIALATMALAGCNEEEKKAMSLLEQANTLYENGEYFAAKSQIDSIRALYPKELKALRGSLELMRKVEYKEAERNIAYCDSLIPIRLHEADSIKNSGFTFEKDSVYEEIGNFIWKPQTIERNVGRSYVRCGVNEKGEMYLASVYFGPRPIGHTGIKVSTKDGASAETAVIPYDGGLNYRFEDLGNTTEVVTYKGEKGIDAAKMIFSNPKERIKVEYTGGKSYVIYMADNDKKALLATYELAVALTDVENLILEKNKATKKIEYLNKKLNAPDKASDTE